MAVKSNPQGDTTFTGVYKKRLGEELKRLRERRLRTGPDMARMMEVSPATYSRSERGQGTFTIRDLRHILDYLHKIEPIPQAKRDELIELQRKANQRGRYGRFYSYVQPATKRYAELEWGANRITELGDMFISGLFQSPGYVRAMMDKGSDASLGDLGDLEERFTSFRQARQQVLTRPDTAPEMLLLQSEAALRMVVGGADVMREQLDHLLKVSELPNVTLRVIPFSCGLPFKQLVMLEFEEGVQPVLVSSSFGTVNTITNYTQLSLARNSFKLAADKAVSAEETSAMIRNIRNSL